MLAIGGVAAVFLYPGFSPDFSANRFHVFLIDFPLLAWLPVEDRWRIAGSMAHWVDTLGAVREFAGFTFCVYLCGALALPRDVLDAARVDGGPVWRRLWTVTLPLLGPTILVATALDLFRVVQILDRPQITLYGSLGESGSTGLIYLIQVSFREGLFGYAAALLVASYVRRRPGGRAAGQQRRPLAARGGLARSGKSHAMNGGTPAWLPAAFPPVALAWLYASLVVVGMLALCTLAGHALARMRYRWHGPLFWSALVLLLMPDHVLLPSLHLSSAPGGTLEGQFAWRVAGSHHMRLHLALRRFSPASVLSPRPGRIRGCGAA